MKIEGLNGNGALAGSQPRSVSAERPRPATTSGEPVALGAAARLAGDTEAPIDPARIQQIRQAIAEGRFRINPEAIAERLIESARELVEGQRRS